MRGEDNPLETWLFKDREGGPQPEQQAVDFSKRLDALAALLNNPPSPPKKIDFGKSGIWYHEYLPPVELLPHDFERAQDLYRKVLASTGLSKSKVQAGLLHHIGYTASSSALPFWLEMLEFAPARDQFSNTRKTFALSALAFIAIKHNLPAAYEALLSAATHSDPDVRAKAVLYLGAAYLEADRTQPDDVVAFLYQVARQDPSFLPRYEARRLMRGAKMEVPLDNQDGTYLFKVVPSWVKGVSRTIEVRSYQTLEDLHLAIQRAYRWDDDHLYSFYLNGVLHDNRYEIPHPALVSGDGGFSPFPFAIEFQGDPEEADPKLKQLLAGLGLMPASGEQSDSDTEDEDAEPLLTTNAVIGELGLVPGHRFLYLFDFGDDNVFLVTVEGTNDKAGRGRYPRVVDQVGKAPPQYEYWDEEEDE